MSPFDFFAQLAENPWSIDLHESQYAYSIIESIHVWTMAVFFGVIAMVDLRLLGFTMRKVPVSEIAQRVLPWAVGAFVILVITGTLLVFAIPLRSYQSIFFRTKMVLLVLAGLNIWLFHSRVFPKLAGHDTDALLPRQARIAGAVSLSLWITVIVLGRMIAYNWFDCDRQPQPAIINFLTSCEASNVQAINVQAINELGR